MTAKRNSWVFGLGLGFFSLLPGCFAHGSGELIYGEPVVYIDAPPDRIDAYPSAEYHGHPAYFVDGRWYYRNESRWVVFRDEPGELRRYRLRQVQAGGPSAARFRERGAPYARQADERRGEERSAEEQRRADEQRRSAEQQRRAEEQRRAGDEQRRAEEQRRAGDEQRRTEEQRRLQEERHGEAQRPAEAPPEGRDRRAKEARKRPAKKRDRNEDDDRDPKAPRRPPQGN